MSIAIADEIILKKLDNIKILSDKKNEYLLLFKDSEFINLISGSINDKTKLESRIDRVKSIFGVNFNE